MLKQFAERFKNDFKPEIFDSENKLSKNHLKKHDKHWYFRLLWKFANVWKTFYLMNTLVFRTLKKTILPTLEIPSINVAISTW